jgi:hypothetical protein
VRLHVCALPCEVCSECDTSHHPTLCTWWGSQRSDGGGGASARTPRRYATELIVTAVTCSRRALGGRGEV